MKIRVATTIAAPRRAVWAAIRDVSTHVDWMHDAEAIRFLSKRRTGVGTRFEADTKVGPFRLTDPMEVTEWREGRSMAIRHRGLVSGEGRFLLRRRRGGTRFVWEEDLRFPRWFGGPLGALVARMVLRTVWKRNLAALKHLVEARQRA